MLILNDRTLCEKCFLPLADGKTVCPYCKDESNTSRYPTALPEGTVLLGKYIVGKVLGKGGFGITYLCYEPMADRRIAIKEYLPDSLTHRNTGETQVSTFGGAQEESFLAGAKKFFEEAKLVSRFNGNPIIISVYEFFYENNTTYYVMEYLDGEDFKTYVTEHGGRISENQVAFVADKMCDALTIVHSLGILHRDVSPDNIFICENGKIKLIDFGAARQVIGEATKSLSLILKQGFAPLEQYQKHGNQGPWTDVYALGASLYYALTGNVIDDAMTRLSDDTLMLDDVTPAFADVIRKTLAIRTDERYQSAVELKQAISMTGIRLEPIEIEKREYVPTEEVEEPEPVEKVIPPVNRAAAPVVPEKQMPVRSGFNKKLWIPILSVFLLVIVITGSILISNRKKEPLIETTRAAVQQDTGQDTGQDTSAVDSPVAAAVGKGTSETTMEVPKIGLRVSESQVTVRLHEIKVIELTWDDDMTFENVGARLQNGTDESNLFFGYYGQVEEGRCPYTIVRTKKTTKTETLCFYDKRDPDVILATVDVIPVEGSFTPEIKVSPASLTLKKGETKTLTVTSNCHLDAKSVGTHFTGDARGYNGYDWVIDITYKEKGSYDLCLVSVDDETVIYKTVLITCE